MSDRVKECLANCDLILAEDTRVSIKLLNHLGIKKRMQSCHNFNEESKLKEITQASRLNQTVALLSDAGTPLISDPGFQIVRQAIACDMQVVPIPGPSAFLVALTGSGLPVNRFTFEGFLPDKISALKSKLAELKIEERTMVFYVAPHKLEKTLSLMEEILGDRPACIGRELTKIHEQFLRANLSELKNLVKGRHVLGECVLVVQGCDRDKTKNSAGDTSEAKILLTIKKMLAKGMGAKEISVDCAQRFGLRRSKAYELVVSCVEKERRS
jgi:16S rRNA (cytidine1402-2'-O)-methyltransferase